MTSVNIQYTFVGIWCCCIHICIRTYSGRAVVYTASGASFDDGGGRGRRCKPRLCRKEKERVREIKDYDNDVPSSSSSSSCCCGGGGGDGGKG